MTDEEFMAAAVRFIDAAAGEGFGFEVKDGSVIHADDLLFVWLHEREGSWPEWFPEELKADWE